MTTISAALLLFLIQDPLGNIPVFLGLLEPSPAARRRIVLLRELLIARSSCSASSGVASMCCKC